VSRHERQPPHARHFDAALAGPASHRRAPRLDLCRARDRERHNGMRRYATDVSRGWRGVTRNGLLLAALLLVLAWQGVRSWELRPVHPADGVLAPDDPVQADAVDGEAIAVGNWMLTPRATYEITARVLGREDYRFDALADLIPEDLALGWGPMSDNAVLDRFEISQSSRFFFWRPLDALPIASREVIEHSANTHVIPADATIARALGRLRIGQVVRLRGLLVDGKRNDGMIFRTSLTRQDSGEGACEVLYVEDIMTE
jgi:hypothetical protein